MMRDQAATSTETASNSKTPKHSLEKPSLQSPDSADDSTTKTMHDPASTPTELQPTSKTSQHPVEKPALRLNDSTTAPPSTADTDGTKSDNTAFPLMSLPPELRLKIYRHHFEDFHCSKGTSGTLWDDDQWNSLSLLRSSSQVRREAAPIFYKECLHNEASDSTHEWLLVGHHSETQDRVEAIRQLVVQYDASVEVTVWYSGANRDIAHVKIQRVAA
jgi:hypothetical protein